MANEPTRDQSAVSAHSSALLHNLKHSTNERIAVRVFRSNIASMRYIFKNGKTAAFLTDNGSTSKYVTNIRHEIEELDEEIALGHPNIHVREEVVEPVIEPLEALKARHFAEFKKIYEAASLKTNDAGYSEQGRLNVANSTTVAEGAAGSDSMTAGSMGAAPLAATEGAGLAALQGAPAHLSINLKR